MISHKILINKTHCININSEMERVYVNHHITRTIHTNQRKQRKNGRKVFRPDYFIVFLSPIENLYPRNIVST